MEWTWFNVVAGDADAALAVAAFAVVLGLVWCQIRRKWYERKELRTLPERSAYDHRFECKPMLNRMQREREILFTRHRAPVGSGEARARRVAAAREKLREQDLLHEES